MMLSYQEAVLEVMSDKLSVRDTEKLIAETPNKSGDRRHNSDRWYEIQAYLSDKLKTKVALKGAKTKGRIEIQFKNDDDLERVYNLIQ